MVRAAVEEVSIHCAQLGDGAVHALLAAMKR